MSDIDGTRPARRASGAPRGAAQDSSAPTHVGRHVIERELGRGGMGVVYLARDTRLDREVALKAIPPSIAADPAARERFEREARLLAALEHPHVASLYGIEDADGMSYLVLQRIEGETISERLRRGALSLVDSLELARQVASGLAAAHRRGITHCDLKPANVMITPDGTAKIVDFGIARRHRRVGSPAEADAAPELEIFGTPAYMSPEQARGDVLDPRTDVWSLGCLLIECLGARPAFTGRDTGEVLEKVLAGEADWSGLPRDLPEPVAALLRGCLERDPERRLLDMDQVRLALDRVSASAAAGPEPVVSSLPKMLTAFIGREAELGRVTELLATMRIVTLTGAAGCGKTRLAVEAAQTAPLSPAAARWFVSLAPILDAEKAASGVAAALGLREDPSRSAAEVVIAHLRSQKGLLVLDNCEHLLTSISRLVEGVVQACDGVVVLCTSREALGVAGEVAVRVPSLAHPSSRSVAERPVAIEQLAQHEGIRFLVERAREARPDFVLDADNAAAVVAIVERLDGIPLALELAAARFRVLAPEQVLARLSDRFRLLTGGSRTALERHQTLRGALEWSHDLLREDERRCLGELSVFVGGFRLEEATRVCSGDEFEVLDLVTSLVNKSLVQVEATSRKAPRYRLLESIRQHAAEKLEESGHSADVRRQHLACHARLAAELVPRTGQPPVRDAMRMLETEHDNLRAALEWSIEDAPSLKGGLELAASLTHFWDNLGLWRESREVLERLLARAEGLPASNVLAHCRRHLGVAVFWLGGAAAAAPIVERAEADAREVGDERLIARAVVLRAMLWHGRGDLPAARAGYAEALPLVRAADDPVLITNALLNIATVCRDMAEREEALRCASEGLVIARQHELVAAEARLLRVIGMLAWDRGEFDEAAALIERGRDMHATLRQKREVVRAGLELAHVARMRGDSVGARAMYLAAATEAREVGNLRDLAQALASAGALDRDAGDLAAASSSLRQALAAVLEIGAASLAAGIAAELAWLLAMQGDDVAATRLLGAVDVARETTGRRLSGAELAMNDEYVASLRERLGVPAFDRAWAEGRDASFDATCHAILSDGAPTR